MTYLYTYSPKLNPCLRNILLILFCMCSQVMIGAAAITTTVAATSFCTGAAVNVSFSSGSTFNSGNVFTAELSNATGSFASPTVIGTLTSTAASGSISATIPITALTGSGYRVRVNASNTATTGTANTVNLSILGRLYVDAGASSWGNGGTWASPLKTLDSALRLANAGNCAPEIWVKAGTYYPMAGTSVATSRDSSFRILQNGIKIYGGFAGSETAVSQRNIAANPTILSGDIGTPNDSTDNSYHVLTIIATPTETIDSSTIIDGFTITGGTANAGGSFTVNGQTFSRQDGGGAYVFGYPSGASAYPKFENVVFSHNMANYGAGIYLTSNTGGSANAVISSCTFSNNTATNYGAGFISLSATKGANTVRVRNSIFRYNKITYFDTANNRGYPGGGAACYLRNSRLYMDDCAIDNNSAPGAAGLKSDRGLCYVTNTSFSNNSVTAVSNTITHSANDIWGSGGATGFHALDDTTYYSNCTFTNNQSHFGGALFISSINATATQVYADSCKFIGNRATSFGGVVANIFGGRFFAQKCVFANNNGAGAFGSYSVAGYPYSMDSLTQCVLTGNTGNGAAYIIGPTNFAAVSSTFSNNDGSAGSRTIYADNAAGSINLTNSIVWGTALTHVSAPTLILNNSLIRNSSAAAPNVVSSPQFVDAADPDGADNTWGTADDGLHLSFISAALDDGDNALAGGLSTDFTGAARIQHGMIDMGAYEGSAIICPGGTRVYVDSSLITSGDGTSWAQAFKTVWEALTVANTCSSVNEIWVKKGTYYPMINPAWNAVSRDSSLRIYRNGIKIYGGFAGSETLLSQRNVTGNPTILSGDIGTLNDSTDNAYHVFTLLPVNGTATIDATTIADGFTIRDGNGYLATGGFSSNGFGFNRQDGGGIYFGAFAGGTCSPQIANCTITNNAANYGGGIYANAWTNPTASSKAVISDCTFSNNNANNAGGGVFNNGNGYNIKQTLSGCTFSNNSSNGSGGAMQNNSSVLSISFSAFNGNKAVSNGGALNNSTDSLSIQSCTFSSNKSVNNGGAFYSSNSVGNVTYSSFSADTAANGGACMHTGGSWTFSDCAFTGNACITGSGGALHSPSGALILVNDTLTRNYSYGFGASVSANGPLTVSNCIVTDNRARLYGGAIHGSGPSTITGSVFERDSSSSADGGAIYTNGTGNLYCVGNFFKSNYASGAGGAMSTSNGNDTIVNNVFVDNKSGNAGGAALDIRLKASDVSFASNNTLVQNSTSGAAAIRISGTSGTVDVYNNLFWANTGGSSDINNVASGATFTQSNNYNTPDPLFLNPSNAVGADNLWGTSDDGLQLSSCSQAINTGTNPPIALFATDANAGTRIQQTTVDPGAYESPYIYSAVMPSVTITISPSGPICFGTPVTFTPTSLNGGSSPVYQWLRNGVLAGTGPSYTDATLANGDTVRVRLLSNASCRIADSVYSNTISMVVNPTPVISGTSFTDPTTCAGLDGTISLNGLAASGVYSVNYSMNGAAQSSLVVTANASGTIVLTGLGAGSYSNFTVANSVPCTSSVFAGPVILTDPTSPSISSSSSTDPTTCGGTDGTISLNGLAASGAYTVNYSLNGAAQPALGLSANGSGTIVLTGMAAGSYSNFAVTNAAGCTSSVYAGPITLADPASPNISSTSSFDPTTCGGTDGTISLNGLTASTSYLVNYWLNGMPQTATITSDGSGVITITGLAAGTFTNISVTLSNCGSNVISGPIVLNPPVSPVIAGTSSADPLTCGGSSGSITLNGLGAGTTYTVTYTKNAGSPVAATITSNASGDLLIGGLDQGVYSNISVTKDNCQSNIIGPLTLSDPPIPSAPSASSNGPVCQGTTLTLSASGQTGASYSWSGPNSFSSATQNPTVTSNMQSVDAGTFSVTQTIANCVSPAGTVVVAMATVPAAPAAITGNNAPCVGTVNAYAILPVATASSYVWTIPASAGWSGSSVTSSINVTAGAAAGTISVAAVNSCGTGAFTSLSLSPNTIPATPSSVNGPTTVCNGSSAYYFVPVVANTTSYTWNLPVGWSGVGLPNPSIIATSSPNSGIISVTANNACGSSPTQNLPVTVISIPAQPGTISGSITPCVNSTQAYSVAAVSGATGYTWSYPTGGSPSWIGGATSSSINLTVGTNNGNITVAAFNQCGSSTAAALPVTVTQLPGQPGVITGKTAPCVGSLATYKLNSTSVGASSYNWTAPGTWTATALQGDSMNVWVGVSGGTITVTPVNACGSGPTGTLAVSVTAIATTGVTLTHSTPSDTICANTSVTFTAVGANGGTNPQYVFRKNGVIVSSFGNTYSDSKLSSTDVIDVTMTSSLPCVTQTQVKDSIRMVVVPLATPGININTTPPIILCTGTTVTFHTNTVDAGTSPGYDWYKNGTALGVTTPTYTTSALANGDSIQVMLTTSAACAAYPTAYSNKVGLNISNMVTPTVAISASPAGPYTPGMPVLFSLTESGGGTAATYQWLKNGVIIPFETSATYSTNTLKSGDHIAVRMLSSLQCASPSLVTSNTIIIQGVSTSVSSNGNSAGGTWNGVVNMYPNPSAGHFTIAADWAATHNNKRVVVDVVSTLGQTIHHVVLQPNHSHWSTEVRLGEEVANGNYMVRLSTEDGMYFIRQITINR